MDKITVEIDQKWIKRINSPYGKLSQVLSGVSVTFAPAFLFFYGKGMHTFGPIWLGVPLCFIIILLPSFFHIKLAQYVIKQIYEITKK